MMVCGPGEGAGVCPCAGGVGAMLLWGGPLWWCGWPACDVITCSITHKPQILTRGRYTAVSTRQRHMYNTLYQGAWIQIQEGNRNPDPGEKN